MRQLALLTAVCLLAGCGSATATHSQSTPPGAAASLAPSAACGGAVGDTLGTVAARIYHEAASGGDVAQAVHRVVSSAALASAVNAGNGTAAGAALRGLLLNQIVAIEVLRGGRVLARAGGGAAIAPVRGSIPGTSATYVLSVQSDRSYLQVVNQVTGAQVLLLGGAGAGADAGGWRRLAGTMAGTLPAGSPTDGAVSVAGKSFQAHVLTGAVYPSGTLHVALLTPSAGISCPGSLAQARVETLGHVGEAIYREELHSPDVGETVRHMEHAAFFTGAVAAQDPAATRSAIVRFFREHIHVVRVRVTVGGHLLVDVGGPYVLAPVQGVLRSGGRVVGHFEMAIQDDAGYLKLAHLFTGAQVLMRVGSRQVMGTLSPGPPVVPDRGSVSYGGHTYEAYSFTGEAFPSGPLRISLLLAS
ncbi:MAG TPA: hypothetical protein VL972_05920 [Solirubrobacteraceae bacterium]|nr:hypothetical protein [Solirubrobacteraceae bacterium]